MTRVEPEFWVDRPREAVEFYTRAFNARVLHQVGHGDAIVAQLAVGDAAFWLGPDDPGHGRFTPRTVHGATGRTLLITDDPAEVIRSAVEAGATEKSALGHEHGWLLGRIIDPFGHEWEIGKPTVPWPPGEE